jgi:hypothetical protein
MSRELRPRPRAVTAAVILLLLLMVVLSGGAARRESATIDEVAHLGAGVSYLQKLDMRMNVEHPPLAKMLAALPLVLRGVHADYSQIPWTFSTKMFNAFLGEWVFGHWLLTRWNDPVSTLFWARVPMLLLTLALGFVLYLYGSRLGGPWGGLLGLCAFVTTPAFLAFGPLVLTDIAITLFCLLAMWTFADLWRDPNRKTLWRFALALAAALLTKFSSGLLFFFFVAFILVLHWWPLPGIPQEKAELRAWRRTRWKYLAKGTALAALIVYAAYFVLSWNQPSDSLQFLHVPAWPLLRRLLMPPFVYLEGLVMFAFTASRSTFILGHAYAHGVWFYYPVLFGLKSQLSFLLLLALAPVVAVVARRRLAQLSAIPEELRLHWRAIWVFLLVFTAACMLGRMDISIRHFSIPIALLILLLAPLPRMLQSLQIAGWRPARAGVWATVALCVVSLFVAVRAYPYYFPFVNSLSFGRPIYMLFNDSNLDWNQSLPEVETFVRQRGLKQVLVDEYGFSDPTVYVPQARFWNCQEAAPADGGQWAVVSAGLIVDGHNCLWLLRYPHQALAGGSMYAFQLPAVIPPAGAPGGPPLPAEYHDFAGMPLDQDWRLTILNVTRDPRQLQPLMDRMMAMMAEAQKQQKKKE